MSPAEKKAFLAQFTAAHAEVQRLKKAAPYLFNEWQVLKAAEKEVEEAKGRLKRAQERWKDL